MHALDRHLDALATLPGVADAVEAALRPGADLDADVAEPALGALLGDERLAEVLTGAVVGHIGWETVLRGLRRHLLREAAHGRAARHRPMLHAFARQAELNEYVWWGTHEARAIRAMLAAEVEDELERGHDDDALATRALAIAMYGPVTGWIAAPRPPGPARVIGRRRVRVGLDAVEAARRFVRDEGDGPTTSGVRRVRRAIVALPHDHPARAIVDLAGFYTTSGVRQLLFLGRGADRDAGEHRRTGSD